MIAIRSIVLVAIGCFLAANARAETTVSDVADTRPQDSRLEPLKDLNGFFPLVVPETKEQWEKRAEELRRRILVSTGLWPMPEKTPLNAVIHGKVSRPAIDGVAGDPNLKRIGFTVERVYFESMQDHFVTGLLFRPDDGKTDVKRPAVLSPHGHGGRLQRHSLEKMSQLKVDGEEPFRQSGQYPKLARCAHLARMGCVCFIFDMLGYADSQQISRELAHGFREQRPEFESKESWGLFSTQAEMRLQSVMGIQTWNSIRCLDFLESLPDVDPKRMAVTGGSGGGTQTILLCAIDDRPIAAFPNGMVSSSMQGGCTCENCTLLRVGTGNVELAALFAPKPQAMTAADDWTKEMLVEGKGFSELQQIYDFYGAKDLVDCKKLLHFPHNYNYVSRAAMYSWFNKHLKLGHEDNYTEEDYELLSEEEMRVWDDEHPQPPGGEKYERELTKYLADVSDQQLQSLTPRDEESLQKFRSVVGPALQTLIGRDLPKSSEIAMDKLGETEQGDYFTYRHVVRLKTAGESVPISTVWPVKTKWNGDVVIWLGSKGQQSLFAKPGKLDPKVQALVDKGATVLSPDLFMQGSFLKEGDSDSPQRVVKNPREAAAYSFCYNHTLFAQRVHDVLTLVSYIRNFKAPGETPERLHLVATNGTGAIALAARAIAGSKVDKATVHIDGFRFADLKSYRDPNFLPGIVKYGDVQALAALNAPYDLTVVDGSNHEWQTAEAAYQVGQGTFAVETGID